MVWLLLALLPAASSLRIAVTGASGYLGAEATHLAAAQGHSVRAVVRRASASEHLPPGVELMVADDLTDAVAAREVAADMDAVIHCASVFRRCDDMEEELVKPNIELAEQMVCACAASGARLILTSSMAAVRASGQLPKRGASYTTDDWNNKSERQGPGFQPYQYSKAESERRAWELAGTLGVEMVSLCPSMIFGPPRNPSCAAFSVDMVRRWVKGEAPIESRLVCDVRDVAQAHINAATRTGARGHRYIVSTDSRIPALEIMHALQARLGEHAGTRLRTDNTFDGGVVPIGAREVIAREVLEAELGVVCRPTTETIVDMAVRLLEGQSKAN